MKLSQAAFPHRPSPVRLLEVLSLPTYIGCINYSQFFVGGSTDFSFIESLDGVTCGVNMFFI